MSCPQLNRWLGRFQFEQSFLKLFVRTVSTLIEILRPLRFAQSVVKYQKKNANLLDRVENGMKKEENAEPPE